MNFKTFGDFYSVESPDGRKQFFKQQKEEKEKQKVYDNLESTKQSKERKEKIRGFIKPFEKILKSSQLKTGYIQSDINKPLQRVLNRSQTMLQELMGGSGEQVWGTGEGLPKVNEGGGIDRNDDGSTGSLFGIKKRRYGFA